MKLLQQIIRACVKNFSARLASLGRANQCRAVTCLTGCGALFALTAAAEPVYDWARRGGGPGAEFGGRQLALDAAGNVYTAGYFEGTATFGGTPLVSAGFFDAFILKHDPAGNLVWARRAGGADFDFASGVTTDGAGNFYVLGDFYGAATFGATPLTSAGRSDVFLTKLDANGNFVWAVQAGGADYDFSHAAAADPAGNVYAAGQFEGTATFGGTNLTSSGVSDAFIAKYDASGSVVWATKAGGVNLDNTLAVAADASGAFMAGRFQGTATFGAINLVSVGGFDTFIARLDTNGQFLWAVRGGGLGNDQVDALTADGAGNVFASGVFQTDASFGGLNVAGVNAEDSFIVRVNSAGVYQWAVDSEGNGNVLALSGNHLYAGGGFARFNATTGALDWEEELPVSVLALGITDGGRILFAGQFKDAVTLGNDALVSVGLTDVFVAQCEDVPPTVPVIRRQPQGLNVFVGSPASFSVKAIGASTLTYQWRLNGANIPGATNATFAITTTDVTSGGRYSVVVQNDLGLVESLAAQLVIVISELPMRDLFADRVTILGNSGAGFSANAGATIEAGEPRHAGKTNNASMWITWRPSTNGIAMFRTSGSAFDTLLGVYTGGMLNSLVERASDEDGGGFLASSNRFNAVAGIDYHIAVAGYGGAQGRIVLSWSLEPTTDQLPEITAHPQSRTVAEGSNVSFNVTAGGVAPLTYQWYLNGAPLAGETSATLNLGNAQRAQLGGYFARVRNGLGRDLDSRIARLEFGLDPAVRSEDKLLDLFDRPPIGAAPQDVRPRPRPAGPFTVATGIPGTQLFSTLGATAESGEPDNARVIGGTSRWFELEVTATATLVVDTVGSDFDTTLGLYAGTDLLDLVPVAEDDNGAADGRRSRVRVDAIAPGKYLVKVDGRNGDAGSAQLNWVLGSAPQITQQPVGGTLPAGGQITLTVAATGVPSPQFRWYLNGQPLPGRTLPTLAITGATGADAGEYYAAAVNGIGSVESTRVMVQVESGGGPRFGSNATLTPGGFQLQFDGPPGVEFVIYASTNLQTWVPVHTNSGAFPFLDPNVAGNRMKFYKGVQR